MAELERNTALIRIEDIAQREIEGELLLVPVRTSPDQELGIFTLNRTAAHIWEALAEESTVGDLAGSLCRRFKVDEQTALRDTIKVCQDLISANAIEVLNSSEGETG